MLKHNINYFENGQQKEISIGIVFVSNRVNRDYLEMVEEIVQFKTDYDLLQKKMENCSSVLIDKAEGWEDRIKDIENDVYELKLKMADYSSGSILEKRFDLITRLLKDNGVKDERLYNYEFWDENIEPDEAMKLLTLAVNKDKNTVTNGEKKK